MATLVFLMLMVPGLLLLTVVVLIRLFGGSTRALRWASEGKCLHCGYDLRASPMRCPECGAAAARFSLLDADDLSTFDKAFALYSQSIDPAEQKPREVMIQMLRRSDYRFVLFRHQGSVAGLAVVFVAATAGFSLLEYLAIRSDLRGAGLGSTLFQEAARVAASVLGPMPGPMLIEVESAGEQTASELAQGGVQLHPAAPTDAARRQAFYRRLGCRRIAALPYILPLHPDGPPMDLLACGARNHLTRDELAGWLSIIYSRAYGCPRHDPRIALMLRSIGQTVEWE